MRKMGGFFQGYQRLIGFQSILMMVRMSLQFIENIVRKPVRSIPAMLDCYLFVFVI